MPSVDNRVVEMRFDNKDFETGVSESISSLDKLKSSLKFKDEVEGLNEIDRAAESINKKFSVLGTISDQLFRNLANEIYQVKQQFVGMVKSLSTDQIAAGWDKYAVKTQAVQTIMAATANQITDEGERMAYVTEQLDRLNWFADETSASLMDMTNNISKFTNNGVELESAVTSMQGIANWGYLSGANINEMSRAMYNLSQALSVGAVTLIDWKSIENANMATVEFKQTALDTAVAVGTLTKVSEGLYKTLEGNEVTLSSFNQYLTKDRWFNKEVLMQTLDKYGAFTNELAAEMDKIEEHQGSLTTSKFLEYIEEYEKGTININEATKRTGLSAEELINDLTRLSSAEYTLGRKAFAAAQEAKTFTEALEATKDAVSSKWMQTFEIIFGDYQNAKKLWTKLSNELWDIFAAGGDARNDMLKEWAKSESGGYKVFWDSVWNIWEGLKGLGGRIKAAWKAIFPGLDSEKLIAFTEKLYDFSVRFRDRFVEVEEAVEAVSTTVGNGIEKIGGFFDKFLADRAPGEAVDEIGELNDAVDDHIVKLARTIMMLDTLVAMVNGGEYSVNPERFRLLDEQGYDARLVQNEVNALYDNAFRYEIAEEDMAKATELVNKGLIDEEGNLKAIARGTKEATEEVKEARHWTEDLRDVLGGIKSALDLIVEGGKLAVKYLVVPAWNFLVNVFKKVLAVIAPFSRAFSDFVVRLKESGAITRNIEKLVDWFSQLKENLKGQENIQKLIGYFGEIKEKLDGFKEEALNRVIEFFDKIVDLDINLPDVSIVGEWIDGLVGYITPAIDKLNEFEGFWPRIKAFFEGLDFSGAKNFGKSAGEGISEFLKTLFTNDELRETGKSWFGAIWEGFKSKIEEIDWGEVIGLIGKAVGTSVLVKLGLSISNFFNGLGNISKGTLGFFESIGKAISSFSTMLKATAFLEVAIGIGIIAAAMFALSKLDQEDLANVTVDLAAVILAMAVLMKVLSGVGQIFGDKTKFKNIGRIQIYLPRLGITLLGLGVALLGIAVAVKVLSGVYKEGTLWKVFGFLAALFGGLTFLSVLLQAFDVNGSKMLKAAAAFAILAIGLDLLVPAIATLTALASGLYTAGMGKALWSSIASIVTLMVAFGALALMAKKADNILAVAGAFAIFSVAILLLTPALVTLIGAVGATNWWSLLVIVGSIGLLFVALGATVAIVASAEKNGKDVKGGVKAMLAMAAGIVAIGAVLYALRGSTFKELMGIVGSILILVGALSLIAIVVGATLGANPLAANGIVAVATAMALIGAAAALAGVGVLAFAKALQILSDSSVDAKKTGKNLAEGVIAFFDELVANGKSIVEFIGLLVMAVAGAIIAKKANVVDAGAKILSALGEKVLTMIEGSTGKIILALAIVIAAALSFLGLNVESIITSILGIFGLVINGIASGLLKTGGYIAQAISNLADALGHLIVTVFDNALSGALENSTFGKIIQSFSDESIDKITESLGLGKWTDTGLYKAARYLVHNAAWNVDTMDLSAVALEKRISDVNAGLNEVVSEASDNIISISKIAKENYEKAGKTVQEGVNGYNDELYKIVSFEGPIEINGIILDKTRVDEIREQFLKGIITPENVAEYVPEVIKQGTEDAVSNGDLNLGNLIQGLIANQIDPEKIADVFSDYGLGVTTGLSNGITDGEQSCLDAYSQLLGSGESYTQDFLEEHSPSKLMARHGENIVLGLGLGITETEPRLLSAMSAVFRSLNELVEDKVIEIKNTVYRVFYESFNADNLFQTTQDRILEAFNSVVARISSAIDGDFDMSPVIRPVLDLSEIQNGSARIGSILGANGYSFNPNLSYGMVGANNVIAATGQMSVRSSNLDESLMALRANMLQINNDNKTIINALGRYLPYIPEFAHMQVTLDKKTIVGELTPAINAKLGDIALKKR